MDKIIFYTKPGCLGGKKQQAHLESLGYELDVRSIFEAGFTPEALRPFFGNKTIKDWYNHTAPAVKAGQVLPGSLDEEASLLEMCEEPILIKRPLIVIGEKKLSGYDPSLLSQVLESFQEPERNLDVCQNKDEQC